MSVRAGSSRMVSIRDKADEYASSDLEHSHTEYNSNSSSEDDDKQHTDHYSQYFTDTPLKWTTDPSSMRKNPFIIKPKLFVASSVPSSPIEYFHLILDNNFMSKIVKEINEHAAFLYIQRKLPTWNRLTLKEFKIFLGLVLHTGMIQLERLSDYWNRHYLYNIPCFSSYMTRNRFFTILRCLDFNRNQNNRECLSKIDYFIDYFNNRMKNIYYPRKQLYLDRSVLVYRGRLVLRKCSSRKERKHGVNLYSLAEEPDGTVIKLKAYSGADNVEKVVFDLLQEKLDAGHSLYMDEEYSSYGLALKLLQRNTYCTGVLGNNRKGNPQGLATFNLEKGENRSFFLNGVHIGKWRDKRTVLYVSTEFGDEQAQVTSRRGELERKPRVILYLDRRQVMSTEEMLAHYPCKPHKPLRTNIRIFLHLLQICTLNSYSLYKHYSTAKISIYNYRMSIIEELLPQIEILPKNIFAHKLSKIENVRKRPRIGTGVLKVTTEVVRKECKTCKRKKVRTATIYECKGCDGVPGYCVECFFEHH